jgi:hypothetical protein
MKMKTLFTQAFWAIALSATVSFVIAISAAAQVPITSQPGQSTDRQSDDTSSQIKGFNEYENFRGMANSSGSLLKLDSTLGYDFNRYVGIFTGVPLYFANDSTGSATSVHAAGAGDIYFGVEAYAPNSIVSYSTSLTVSAPTGSVSKGFSPGQATVDWSNRFRHHFGRFTPFVAAGLGNTVPDSELVTRNFTSIGDIAHFEEGAEFELTKRIYVGSSAYQIVPFGNQQVFNRFSAVVPVTASPQDDKGGAGKDGPAPSQPPPGNSGQPSASGDDLTRERGFDAWLGFEPTRIVRLELGYSRSATFALNSFSFNVGFNVGKLFHSQQTH